MKKTMIYAATAVLLGFAVMMLPLALQTGRQPTLMGGKPNAQQPTDAYRSEGSGNGDVNMLRDLGLGRQLLGLLPSSLVFFSGLIVALSVYVILKRRM